jgi:23S rRNA pseudouridine2605 synthase
MNGKVVTETGAKCNARKDKITVDGKLLILPDESEIFWLALNKPRGVLTTMEDENGRETVLKYIPKANELRLVPVGRMERDASGLILLTNEVGWIHPLTHASFPSFKRYEIVVKGFPAEDAIDKLRKGRMGTPNGDALPMCTCRLIDADANARLTLMEISFKDAPALVLEKIVAQLGCELISTKRTAFGSVELRSLRKGDWRELSKAEVFKLKDSCTKQEGAVRTKR